MKTFYPEKVEKEQVLNCNMKWTAFSEQDILTELHATGKLLTHSSGSLLLTKLICAIVIKGTYLNIRSKANVGFFSTSYETII